MEVALSRRVSTSRQQQHQTIAQQRSRLRDDVATRPDWSVADEHIYRDDGSSGATRTRPGLDRLNWLRVLGTAERSQVDQRIRQQLHAIVSLLDAFKAE